MTEDLKRKAEEVAEETLPFKRLNHVKCDPRDFLRQTPVLEAWDHYEIEEQAKRQRTDVSVVDAKSLLTDAFKTLIRESIHSAPIWNAEKGVFLGFIDVLDVVSVVDHLTENHPRDKGFLPLLESTHMFQTFATKTVADLNGRDAFRPVQEESTLLDAASLMAIYGCPRVAVLNSRNEMRGLVTQMDVCSYLFKHLECFEIAKRTVQQLFIGLRDEVVSVRIGKTALSAFKTMAENKVVGVAVVDEDGRLHGNVSASDIKLIDSKAGHLGLLYSNVEDFVDICRQANPSKVLKVVSCTLEDTLGMVLEKLVENNIHRLYVVHSDRHVCGVISLRDVLQEFLREHMVEL